MVDRRNLSTNIIENMVNCRLARRARRNVALPDFLVAGVPKAGTTALHTALSRHPGLFMSPIREPKFFLTDGAAAGQRRPGGRADLPGARLAAGQAAGTVPADASPPTTCRRGASGRARRSPG